MLPTILGIAGIGFVVGLVLVHWLMLAFICLAGTVFYVFVGRWDWLLLPKWFALLTAFQLAYLAGAAIRLWLADRSEDESPAASTSQDEQGERALVAADEPLVAAAKVEEVQTASGRPARRSLQATTQEWSRPPLSSTRKAR